MISFCLAARTYTNISRETPTCWHIHVKVQTHAAINTGQRLFNAPCEHRDSVVQTTEAIWHSVHRIPDAVCFCPKGMMLTHPPTTLAGCSHGKDHKVVYNLIWHQSLYYPNDHSNEVTKVINPWYKEMPFSIYQSSKVSLLIGYYITTFCTLWLRWLFYFLCKDWYLRCN